MPIYQIQELISFLRGNKFNTTERLLHKNIAAIKILEDKMFLDINLAHICITETTRNMELVILTIALLHYYCLEKKFFQLLQRFL